MKISMRNWQPAAGNTRYKNQAASAAADMGSVQNTDTRATDEPNSSADTKTQKNSSASVLRQEQERQSLLDSILEQQKQDQKSFLSAMLGQEQEKESLLSSLLGQAKESSGFKVSVSMPDDSVGQLATELARSESKMDVQQISSKAMRALATLKMAYALSEGKDKEKIAQMIRRMQKLTKQIRKKVKNLTKEEQLELQRKHAEERREMEKETEIRKEIAARRKKRRREENNYAAKEVGQDRKEALQETMDAMAAGIGGSSSAGLPAAPGVSSIAVSSAAIAAGTEAYTASMENLAADSAAVDVAI